MSSALPIAAILVLIAMMPSTHCSVEDLVGTVGTLNKAGLAPTVAKMEMIEFENMDVEKEEENEGVQEDIVKEKEEKEKEEEEKVAKPLIVKGHPAYPGMLPFQAAVILNTSLGFYHFCGAIILSPRRALTAAHCTRFMEGPDVYDNFIGVGIHNKTLGLLNPGAQMARVTHYENHPKYKFHFWEGFPNDIAVLYLDKDIVENDYVEFARIANDTTDSFEDQLCIVSGWGATDPSDSDRPDILQFAYQYITSEKDCQNFWAVSGGKSLIGKRQICGHYYPQAGCAGDSGAPLTCDDMVVGLVSWGLNTCSGCFPTIYTRISYYYDWIFIHL